MQEIDAQVREFAACYTDAWCSRDPNRVASLFAATGSLTVNDGPPAIGRPAIADVAMSFMTAFPDLRVMMNELRAREDRLEYHWTLIGTNSGPGGTGRRVRISGFELWRLASDGLIACSEGTFDKAEYQRQLSSTLPNPG
ncbi:MAG TPA: ester cyclase [Terriglobales bacterium]|nr:ester cyclase [Terriglobales bacterium]